MDADRRFGEDPQGRDHREAERPADGRPVVIGLTGAMGAGKTSVARMLLDLGAHVIDADGVARQVVEPGGTAIDEIRAAFGPDVFLDDGTLSRQRLADAVFSSPDRLRCLEAIIHPRILDVIRAEISGFGGQDVAVVDAPLLIESGYHREVDLVWVVVAPLDVRLKRLEGRGLSRDEALRRMYLQLSQEEKIAHADTTIDNGGSLAATERQVRQAWEWVGRRRS